MKPTAPPLAVADSSMDELQAILQQVKDLGLPQKQYELLRSLVESYAFLVEEIGDKKATIKRLRELLFGASTEKTKAVLGQAGPTGTEAAPEAGATGQEPKPPPKGHGRLGAEAYTGVERVKIPHPSLRAGDPCPRCGGRLSEKKPEILLRIQACAPVGGTAHEKQRLRCNLCNQLWVAPTPAGVGEEKFDETVASMIGMLRYGSGVPFYRIAGLQQAMGIPLPASTQWELVEKGAAKLQPALDELMRQAAQGQLLYNDDTSMTILDHRREARRREQAGEEPAERTGTFTSGIVSELDGRQIVLYATGPRHAGENLAAVLARRASGLDPPMQMCDGLDRNLPQGLTTILANCLAHGRRKFVEVVEAFPAEVRHVLEELAIVYRNDAEAKTKGLSPQERLGLHQEKSGPVMERLQKWLAALLEEKKVEPNSTLGGAIAYALKRWDRMTLFLRQAGAPLDNNLCERILKRAILHRKNSMFYKTRNGARVGDLYMSLIATAKLAGVNPFDYLTELQRHAGQAAANPSDWMPWNYRATLAEAAPPA